jgi:hypothetical protein
MLEKCFRNKLPLSSLKIQITKGKRLFNKSTLHNFSEEIKSDEKLNISGHYSDKKERVKKVLWKFNSQKTNNENNTELLSKAQESQVIEEERKLNKEKSLIENKENNIISKNSNTNLNSFNSPKNLSLPNSEQPLTNFKQNFLAFSYRNSANYNESSVS